MRIIGGEYRSRLLEMPKGAEIRPTQDRVREALFNVLGDISAKNVLDLYAGTGAFGLEALSRGAEHATFIENHSRCLSAIESNIESLGVPESRYEIIKGSVLSTLFRLQKEGNMYDIIFLDPPYHKNMAKNCLIYMDDYDILTQSGLVVVEHFIKDSLETDLVTMKKLTERKYGDILITLFKKI